MNSEQQAVKLSKILVYAFILCGFCSIFDDINDVADSIGFSLTFFAIYFLLTLFIAFMILRAIKQKSKNAYVIVGIVLLISMYPFSTDIFRFSLSAFLAIAEILILATLFIVLFQCHNKFWQKKLE